MPSGAEPLKKVFDGGRLGGHRMRASQEEMIMGATAWLWGWSISRMGVAASGTMVHDF